MFAQLNKWEVIGSPSVESTLCARERSAQHPADGVMPELQSRFGGRSYPLTRSLGQARGLVPVLQAADTREAVTWLGHICRRNARESVGTVQDSLSDDYKAIYQQFSILDYSRIATTVASSNLR